MRPNSPNSTAYQTFFSTFPFLPFRSCSDIFPQLVFLVTFRILEEKFSRMLLVVQLFLVDFNWRIFTQYWLLLTRLNVEQAMTYWVQNLLEIFGVFWQVSNNFCNTFGTSLSNKYWLIRKWLSYDVFTWSRVHSNKMKLIGNGMWAYTTPYAI